MCLKTYKAYTPSMRYKVIIKNKNIIKTKFTIKSLILSHSFSSYGKNNQGKITIRHKERGHKKKYRLIDFKRSKLEINGTIITINYDPNRNVPIALIKYDDDTYKYILYPETLKINDCIINYADTILSNLNIGDSCFLKYLPLGSQIHNIEFKPFQKGKACRAAGVYSKIIAKELKFILIELPSGKIRSFLPNCRATIGRLSNIDYKNIIFGKAGRKRWYGIRPTVRGSAMNAVDHPHGGGEGKSPIGKTSPRTPWGKIALGIKTRRKSKKNDTFIIH